MNQSIKIRYALIIVAVAIVMGLVIYEVVRQNLLDVRDVVEKTHFELLEATGELNSCDGDPQTWRYIFGGFRKFMPVDANRNPFNGGALSDAERNVDTVVLGERYSYLDRRPIYGPHFVDTKRSGPCRLFYVDPEFAQAGTEWRKKVFAFIVMITLIAGLILWASLTYPLLRRINIIIQQTRKIIANNFLGKIEESDDELGEIAKAFNTASTTAAEQLAEKNLQQQRLRELLANLAHDIRTPLSSLKVGLSRLMNREYDEKIGRALRAEVEHLDGVFANIAALMQLEASTIPLNFSQVEINRLIDNISIRFAILSTDRGIELNTALPDTPLIANVDPIAMEQAISNLVHNAVKFAHQFCALLLFEEQGEIVIQIIDDGPGVANEEIPHLTKRRFQGGAGRDRGRPGLGLGLAIVNEIVNRHGAKFTIARHRDGGCIAEIRLARTQ